jgi:outer membrane scaffolding protein for murein synthesis (MipA/OmpV family)
MYGWLEKLEMGFVHSVRVAVFAAVAALAGPLAMSAAQAQAPSVAAPDSVTEPGVVRQGDVRVSLGMGVALRPDYAGSRSQTLMPAPVIDIRFRDTLFLSTAGGLPSLGANLINESGWRAGPVVRLRFPRQEKANAVLRGMGDVDWTPEVGGFVEYRAGYFRLGGEVRRGVGDHDGVVAELRADAVTRPADGLTLSFGPRLNLGDESFTRRYFGVDTLQSARTGYPTHRPGGGVTSVGAAVFASYALTSKLSLTGIVEYNRLQGGAADSPLVRGGRGDANQVFTALSLTYSFGW